MNWLARRGAENTGRRTGGNSNYATSRSKVFAVRIVDMFPSLRNIEDMCLFTNHNSVIELQFIMNPAFACLLPIAGLAGDVTNNANTSLRIVANGSGVVSVPNYVVENTALFYQYARLDTPRLDIVLKNEYALTPYIFK